MSFHNRKKIFTRMRLVLAEDAVAVIGGAAVRAAALAEVVGVVLPVVRAAVDSLVAAACRVAAAQAEVGDGGLESLIYSTTIFYQ